MVDPSARVLVIDDNKLDAQLLREAFADCGMSPAVVWAPTGAIGLEFLEQFAAAAVPFLVVLDLNMPGIPGLEILRRMRVSERDRDVPVLVFTTSLLASDREACTALGVSAFLNKPTTFAEYRSIVAAIGDQLRSHLLKANVT